MRTIKILTSIAEDIKGNHPTLKDFEDGCYQAFFDDEYTKEQFQADYRIENGVVVVSECCKFKKVYNSFFNMSTMKEEDNSKFFVDDSEKNIEHLVCEFVKKYVDILKEELEKREEEERKRIKEAEQDHIDMQETYKSLKPSL